MSKSRILLQLDCDDHASSFDAIVAIDSGVDRLLTWSGVESVSVQPLVHGAMFTRGADDLRQTAIFLGGSDAVEVGAVLHQVKSSFFGPVRVSVMVDPNGCNTTAAAALLSVEQLAPVAGKPVLVLGATGPVGMRIARLVARREGQLRLVSRSADRVRIAREAVLEAVPDARVETHVSDHPGESMALVRDSAFVFSAGGAGAQLLNEDWWQDAPEGLIAVDCNAVPPAGLPGVSVQDRGRRLGPATLFGAIGIGGLKMKIHKRCLERLFDRNDQVFDAEEILEIGRELVRPT